MRVARRSPPDIHGIALDGVIDSADIFHRLPECNVAHIQATFEQYIINAFVARYLKKSSIALDRLSIDESTDKPEIVCSRKCDDGIDTRTFSPLEFLAEISQHIPDTWEQTTRYYGCYAARSRKLLELTKETRQETEHATTTDPNPTKPASKYWARWILLRQGYGGQVKKVYEVDPLVCKKVAVHATLLTKATHVPFKGTDSLANPRVEKTNRSQKTHPPIRRMSDPSIEIS